MKFKIDQSLPVEAADLLTVAGHDAMTVFQQSLGGASDEHIVDACKDEDRILITADLDLSDTPKGRQTGGAFFELPFARQER